MKKATLLLSVVLILMIGVSSYAGPKKRVTPPAQRTTPPQVEMTAAAKYLKTVHDQVLKHWKMRGVPLMAQHTRRAVAHLYLNKQGRLIKFRISHSSGLKSYDNSLIKAIKRANPFPPPTVSIRKVLIKRGLEIMFRRRVFRKKLLPLKTQYKGTAVVPNWRPKVDGQRKSN